MKKISLILAVLVILLVGVTPGIAATPEDIETAIGSGLTWLAANQNPAGYWGLSDYVGVSGFALLKMEDYAYEQEYTSPFDPAYLYSTNVDKGFDYIFSRYSTGADTDGDGINEGYFDNGYGGHQTYSTGIALMAISSTGTPDRVVDSGSPAALGKTYHQIAEECVEWFIATQNPDGGWRYVPGQIVSDQSNTGFATMGLTYASVNFGIDISPVLPGLQNWVDNIQNKNPASPLYGGSQYTIGGGWENTYKTGSILYQFSMLSTPVTDPDVQAAIGFIENYWGAPGCDYNGGWTNHRLAMFNMMKGFEAYNIDLIDLDGDDIPESDWFDIVSTHLVTTQNVDGSWGYDCWADNVASTAWALLTLERTVIVPGNQPPVAEANGPYAGSINQLISFSSDGSYDPDGTIVAYDWNWGDGTAHGTTEYPTHAYKTAGTKTVNLTVTDNNGATGSDTATVKILTVCESIQELKNTVKSMTLSPTIRTALNTRLDKALTLCKQGPIKYPAIATLFKNDFIPYVNTKTGRGITPAQAQILIDQANIIIAACGK